MVTWRSPISRKVRMFFAYGYMVFEPVHVLVLQWPAKGSKFQQFLRKWLLKIPCPSNRWSNTKMINFCVREPLSHFWASHNRFMRASPKTSTGKLLSLLLCWRAVQLALSKVPPHLASVSKNPATQLRFQGQKRSLLTSHVSIVGIKDLHILCLAFDTWALDLFQSFRKTCKIITHNHKLATGTNKERYTSTENIICVQIHGQISMHKFDAPNSTLWKLLTGPDPKFGRRWGPR